MGQAASFKENTRMDRRDPFSRSSQVKQPIVGKTEALIPVRVTDLRRTKDLLAWWPRYKTQDLKLGAVIEVNADAALALLNNSAVASIRKGRYAHDQPTEE